jgi:hypothetical protein
MAGIVVYGNSYTVPSMTLAQLTAALSAGPYPLTIATSGGPLPGMNANAQLPGGSLTVADPGDISAVYA